MSIKATKPYSKSQLNIVIVDKTGEQGVISVRLNGHPEKKTAQSGAIAQIKKVLANGNKIVSASMHLITDQLKDQSARVFQPAFINSL